MTLQNLNIHFRQTKHIWIKITYIELLSKLTNGGPIWDFINTLYYVLLSYWKFNKWPLFSCKVSLINHTGCRRPLSLDWAVLSLSDHRASERALYLFSHDSHGHGHRNEIRLRHMQWERETGTRDLKVANAVWLQTFTQSIIIWFNLEGLHIMSAMDRIRLRLVAERLNQNIQVVPKMTFSRFKLRIRVQTSTWNVQVEQNLSNAVSSFIYKSRCECSHCDICKCFLWFAI